MKNKTPGQIVIISSPSGGGKTSICRKLINRTRRAQGWRFSISYTTRKPRIGERNSREYFFVSEEEFTRKVRQNFFAEYCKVHLYHYGTPRKPLENTLKNGGVIVLDIDVQGASKLRKEYPHALTIFIQPPSDRELRKRLKRRGTETKEQLKVRFENAKKEMKLYNKFDYVVVNRELSDAVKKVLCIIEAHPCRTDKY